MQWRFTVGFRATHLPRLEGSKRVEVEGIIMLTSDKYHHLFRGALPFLFNSINNIAGTGAGAGAACRGPWALDAFY